MINIGDKFPAFEKTATVSMTYNKEFAKLSNEDHIKAKQWMIMFWYPKDFTFVCPTEIISFDEKFDEFKKKKTMLIGASTDSEFVHLGWRREHPGLRKLKTPLLADTSKSLAEALGILTNDNEKVAYRATFIVDPKGIVRWVCVNDLSVGRNIEEVVRVLDALQNGGLIPCNWKKGDDTLKV